jgi:exodeoxyribonuclease VII small subunit
MAKTRANVEFSDAQIAKMSYEEARENLQEIVGLLETGGAALEESLGLFELSEKLADRCEEILDAVADKIESDDE